MASRLSSPLASTIAREMRQPILSGLGPAFDTAGDPAVVRRQTCIARGNQTPRVSLQTHSRGQGEGACGGSSSTPQPRARCL